MVVYTSTQGHSCLQKAVELLGIGHDHLRKIPVDAELTKLCEAEKLWFHVDGAYGGFGILSEQASALYAGIERADSLAVDPHKWLYVPVECGCTLVRDAQAMRDSFSVMPPYLRDDAALPWFSEYTIQQTRGFKALKLWMVMQQIGIDGYRELISRDIALARALQQKIRARPEFELVAAGPLSITCFRLAPAGMSEAERSALNKAAVGIVQRSGEAFLTSTELDGKVVLRDCIVTSAPLRPISTACWMRSSRPVNRLWYRDSFKNN